MAKSIREPFEPPWIVPPFRIHHPKSEYGICRWQGQPFLVWRHPDGQWVTEQAVLLGDPPPPKACRPSGHSWSLTIPGDGRQHPYWKCFFCSEKILLPRPPTHP